MQERPYLLWRVFFWCAGFVILLLALAPPAHALHLAPSDKIDHLLAFLVLSALSIYAYPRTQAVTLSLGVIAFGGAIELAQGIGFIHRDPSLHDWIADIAGAGAGTALAVLLRARLRSSAST